MCPNTCDGENYTILQHLGIHDHRLPAADVAPLQQCDDIVRMRYLPATDTLGLPEILYISH